MRHSQGRRDQSPRRWTSIKRRLAFCRITQDGDDEGCLHLDQLPTPVQAGLIRQALGIRKRRTMAENGRVLSSLGRAGPSATRSPPTGIARASAQNERGEEGRDHFSLARRV